MTHKQKPTGIWKNITRLFRYAKKYHVVLLITIILTIFSTIISVVTPTILSQIVSLIEIGMKSRIDSSAISKIGIFLIALFGISAVFSYVQAFLLADVTQKVSRSLRNDLSLKINNLPFKYLDTMGNGDLLSRITNDVDLVAQSLNQSISQMLGASTMFIGSLIMMLLTNLTLALVAVCSVILGFVAVSLIVKSSQRFFVAQQKALGKVNGFIEEIYSGQSVVRAYNGTRNETKRFEAINNTLFGSAWKAQFYSGIMMPLMMFIGNFSYVAVCVSGAILAMQGSISIATVVAFIFFVRLFSQPLSQITQGLTQLQSGAAATERVFEVLDAEELPSEQHKPDITQETKGDIEFKNVSFGYEANKPVIQNFSASVKAGEQVAIVGPSGAGKTTLVNLLMRFYEIDAGEITIDDIPIQNYRREKIHELFGMVLQDAWIFEGTIIENIIYSKKDGTAQQVKEICKSIGLHHFIQTLPHGYETILNEKVTLSAGEKQLLTIARAIMENAPLIILDEATSSVDTRTELMVQSAMKKLTEGRTSFIIAHRLSTIKNADKIFYMQDGNVVEQGTHKELMQKGGLYCKLYNSQFSAPTVEL